MADFATMRQDIADQIGVELDSGPIERNINFAIRRAVRDLRHRPFAWNRKDLAITPLVEDQLVYEKGATASDLPSDFLFLHGGRLWCEDTSASSYDAWEMTPLTLWEMEDEKIIGGTAAGDSGQPKYFNLKADEGDQLHIYPAADATTYKLFGSYIIDLGEPTFTISSGTYTWSADGFTNDWFDLDLGYELVKLQALGNYYGGYGANIEKSQMFRQLLQQELLSQTVQEEKNRSTRVRTGWYTGLPRRDRSGYWKS